MTFEKLDIPILKRVNLITGKNNAGKTALLEALRVLTSSGHNNNTVINDILIKRENFQQGREESYENLFNRVGLSKNIERQHLWLKINHFYIKRQQLFYPEYSYSIKDSKNSGEKILNANINTDYPRDVATFISFRSSFKQVSKLWEQTVLTPKESIVIKILQEVIDKNITRLDVGADKIRVLLKGQNAPVSLGSLGDGMQRILSIALGLVNAQNSYLLIDEIELGLHHSVMKKLWQLIFEYAKKWNIQVFATTHSKDAIKAFFYVASTDEYKEEGQVTRIQIGRDGSNESIIYDDARLETSIDLELEIR